MLASFRGIITPLITPITPTGEPDLDSFCRLVDCQLDAGVHGLWVMGTSAEFAAFTPTERESVIRAAVRASDGRIPVIANISDAATRLAIEHGRRALNAGVTAVAATPPYYYPHSQDEVTEHYRAIHRALDLPLFIYNIPQTVKVRVELTTARTLTEEGTAMGIKDSQNDLEWFRQLASFAARVAPEFAALAGTRHLIDAAVLAGGRGAVPSIANILPRICVGVYEAAAAGDFRLAARRQEDIIAVEALNAGLAGSRNAATLGLIKAVLASRGIIRCAALTAPLRAMTAAERDNVVQCVQSILRDQ